MSNMGGYHQEEPLPAQHSSLQEVLLDPNAEWKDIQAAMKKHRVWTHEGLSQVIKTGFAEKEKKLLKPETEPELIKKDSEKEEKQGRGFINRLGSFGTSTDKKRQKLIRMQSRCDLEITMETQKNRRKSREESLGRQTSVDDISVKRTKSRRDLGLCSDDEEEGGKCSQDDTFLDWAHNAPDEKIDDMPGRRHCLMHSRRRSSCDLDIALAARQKMRRRSVMKLERRISRDDMSVRSSLRSSQKEFEMPIEEDFETTNPAESFLDWSHNCDDDEQDLKGDNMPAKIQPKCNMKNDNTNENIEMHGIRRRSMFKIEGQVYNSGDSAKRKSPVRFFSDDDPKNGGLDESMHFLDWAHNSPDETSDDGSSRSRRRSSCDLDIALVTQKVKRQSIRESQRRISIDDISINRRSSRSIMSNDESLGESFLDWAHNSYMKGNDVESEAKDEKDCPDATSSSFISHYLHGSWIGGDTSASASHPRPVFKRASMDMVSSNNDYIEDHSPQEDQPKTKRTSLDMLRRTSDFMKAAAEKVGRRSRSMDMVNHGNSHIGTDVVRKALINDMAGPGQEARQRRMQKLNDSQDSIDRGIIKRYSTTGQFL